MTSRPHIKVSENGPYLVRGAVPLFGANIILNEESESVRWLLSRAFAAREVYQLCRCGRSANPPFCDGSHHRIQFNGRETAVRKPYLEQARRIRGPGIGLTDDEPLCASARFCLRSGGIWNLVRHSGEQGARKTATQEAFDCPAGRLVVWDVEGRALEPELAMGIGVVRDARAEGRGPLWVRGGIPVESADGYLYEVRNRVTLCRCGRSRNKPFCNGNHGMPVVPTG